MNDHIHPIFQMALMPFSPKPASAEERKRMWQAWEDRQEEYDAGLDDVDGRFHDEELEQLELFDEEDDQEGA